MPRITFHCVIVHRPNKLTVKQKLTLNCLQAKMNGVNHQVIIFKTEEEKWRKFMLYLNKQQSVKFFLANYYIDGLSYINVTVFIG